MKPRPPAPPSLGAPIRAAMRESPPVRAALARLSPADRLHAGKAIAEAIAARLDRAGWSR